MATTQPIVEIRERIEIRVRMHRRGEKAAGYHDATNAVGAMQHSAPDMCGRAMAAFGERLAVDAEPPDD